MGKCISLVAFSCALALCGTIFATPPVVSIVTDTPLKFDGSLTEFAVPTTPGTTDYLVTSPGTTIWGTNWRVTMTQAEFFNGLGIVDDTVTLKGTFRHIITPHGEGVGPIFNFQFLGATNGGAASGTTVTYGPQGGTLPHPPHDDIVDIRLQVTSAGTLPTLSGGLISSWRLLVVAQHTPEPSTGLLLSAAGVVLFSSRRRRCA